MKASEIKNRLLETGYFVDNIYLGKYVKLIADNLKTGKTKGLEGHHILQRNYFKLIESNCDDSSNNLVWLTYKDHVLAHYYLALCTTGKLRQANCCAFFLMTNSKFKLTVEEKKLIEELDEFQKLREEYIEYDSVSKRIFTPEEDEIIRKYYPTEGVKGCKKYLNKPVEQISVRAGNLNIQRIGYRWTESEIELLKKYYPIGRYKECKKYLKNKTSTQIADKASSLKLITKERSNIHKPKKVRCIETGEIFDSIGKAELKYPCNGVGSHLRGYQKSAGHLPDGTKLHWEYVEEDED